MKCHLSQETVVEVSTIEAVVFMSLSFSCFSQNITCKTMHVVADDTKKQERREKASEWTWWWTKRRKRWITRWTAISLLERNVLLQRKQRSWHTCFSCCCKEEHHTPLLFTSQVHITKKNRIFSSSTHFLDPNVWQVVGRSPEETT